MSTWRLWGVLLGLSLAMCLPMSAGAQSDPNTDEPPPAQANEPPTPTVVHPHITVNGIQTFYHYDALGRALYYYFDPSTGARIDYPLGWRPYYMAAGQPAYFTPTPYVLLNGLPVYYYWQGNAIRYYRYSGGQLVYYPAVWRPWYLRGGVRVHYVPPVRFYHRHWVSYRPYARVYYRPRLYRTLYTRHYTFRRRHPARYRALWRTTRQRYHRARVIRRTRVIRRVGRPVRVHRPQGSQGNRRRRRR